MKKSKTTGTAIIEFNHGGIPDDKLHPEVFSEYQSAVLNSLPSERQEPIRRGCPVKVIDLDTGDVIAAFNMKNVEPTKFQKQMLARALYESMQRYFSNPENEVKFREWEEKRKMDKGRN